MTTFGLWPPRDDRRLPVPTIVDTDANNELDDQHALAYLLANADHFALEGITTNCTYNGGPIHLHTREAARVVQLMTCEGLCPIVPGATGEFVDIAPFVGRGAFDGLAAANFIAQRALAATAGRKLLVLAIGKLTNVALALYAHPAIADRMRVVWLGSHWPDLGEYNLENDPSALAYTLRTEVELDIAVVRYGADTGTSAVHVSLEEVRRRMPGLGPRARQPVSGRHGGRFHTFGDYSLSLYEHMGQPRCSLFDVAAVAVAKNPLWARAMVARAPDVVGLAWSSRVGDHRRVRIFSHFDRDGIVEDLFESLANPCLPQRLPLEAFACTCGVDERCSLCA